MSESWVTTVVSREDGTQALLLQTAELRVISGPDEGLAATVDRLQLLIGSGAGCGLRLRDPTVSRRHAEVAAMEQRFRLRDLGSTNGTWLGSDQVIEARLAPGAQFSIGNARIELRPSDDQVEIALSRRNRFGGLLGRSLAMRQLFALLERVADTDSTVLISGESGTGKDLAATALHSQSKRRAAPLVVVDCAALPPTLAESELFGHLQGAFTGASVARRGAFEQAQGGTLFLDEIGELPIDLQPRLLRVLERREVKPLGADRYRAVNVRIVAATNRVLEDEVEAGRFRADLLHRLGGVSIEMPPLRDRPDDIVLLAHHFAQLHHADPKTLLTDEVEQLLCAYSWPGNVRELRCLVEQLSVLPERAKQALRHPRRPHNEARIGALSGVPFHDARKRWQDLFERQYVQAQLERHGGVVARAARAAELPRQTFHELLRRHGLKRAKS